MRSDWRTIRRRSGARLRPPSWSAGSAVGAG